MVQGAEEMAASNRNTVQLAQQDHALMAEVQASSEANAQLCSEVAALCLQREAVAGPVLCGSHEPA